ncbi:MAG: phosphate ABC transporter permease subunit PstC [Verrucomicrobiales bacterium]|nr:phosphate ABC transporter permease subunit PstC [Verrucomicrobiales bacterium]
MPQKSSGWRALSAKVADKIETPVEILIRTCGWSAIVIVAAIIFFNIKGAAPLLPHVNWVGEDGFFTSTNWHAKEEKGATFGVLAMIVGNFGVAGLAMLMAIPLGLGSAVFISEFAGSRTREWLKIGIEILAAIPSIVWGFIGLTIIGPLLIKHAGATMGANLLNGAIILGLMSIPLIVSLAEDALRAVPDSYREAAMALGANRWEIVYRVLFPAAKSGLLASCMLGVGRAVGETMAVLLATGNKNQIPHALTDPITTLTATIAAEMGDAEVGSQHSQALFLIGVLLLLITCTINLTADFIIRGTKRKANA